MEKLKKQNQDNEKLNFELKKELSTEKSETDVLKQRMRPQVNKCMQIAAQLPR